MYDTAEDVAYVNFEGLSLRTANQARDLAGSLDEWFASLGRRVHVIVNYDAVVNPGRRVHS